MTVYQLMKILGKASPRAKVCVYVDTFKKPIEEMNCLDVESASYEFLPQVDGDGYGEYRADGQQKGRMVILLRGDHKLKEEI
jgi:hypothetical protein